MLPSPSSFNVWGSVSGNRDAGRRRRGCGKGARETCALRKVGTSAWPRPQTMAYLKQRDILSQELGQVDIQQCPEQQDALVLLWVLELQVAGGREHRLDGPHAVVIVMLGGKLLRAQAVGRHNLLGETGRQRHMCRPPRPMSCSADGPTIPGPCRNQVCPWNDGGALSFDGLSTELPS